MRKALRKLYHAWTDVNILLRIGLGISIVLLLCIEFWWKHIWPPMFGWRDAHEGADIMKDLLLAFIASFIFYFMGDHWKNQERLRAMFWPVVYRMIKILGLPSGQLIQLSVRRRWLSPSTSMVSRTSDEVYQEHEALFWRAVEFNDPNDDLSMTRHVMGSGSANIREAIEEVLDRYSEYDPHLTFYLEQLLISVKRFEIFQEPIDFASARIILKDQNRVTPTFVKREAQLIYAWSDSVYKLSKHVVDWYDPPQTAFYRMAQKNIELLELP